MDYNPSAYPNLSPITLSTLTSMIGRAVNAAPSLSGVWVTAELSDVRVNGGHCYMELVEKNSAGQTVAKLRATIWQSTFRSIRQQFIAVTGKDIMSGMKVLLRGSASHHSLYGLSFNVTGIDAAYTLGDIERIRREILQKLTSEGVVDLNKSLSMPVLPQKIAIISAEGAAGYGDFIDQLSHNSHGFVFYPFLFRSIMQGEKTVASVLNALDIIESTIDLWDCVVILRGGGATTDLVDFDNYSLARRIATFPLPVVVGIGHERDRTVLDEIAHTRVKTPTAAASFFIDCARKAYESSCLSVSAIIRYVHDALSGERARIAGIEAGLPALVSAKLERAKALLKKDFAGLPLIVRGRINHEIAKLDSIGPIIANNSKNRIILEKKKIGDIEEKINLFTATCLNSEKTRLDHIEGLIKVLSPSNTLKRGYSVVRLNGKALRDPSQVKKGEKVNIELCSGEIHATVD